MIDILTNIHKLCTYRHALSRRFLPFTAVCVGGAGYQALGFAGLIVSPANQTLVLMGFLLCASALLASACVRLPHEKFWVKKVNTLINECRYDDAKRLLEKGLLLPGFAVRIERLLFFVQLANENNDFLSAYHWVLTTEKKALRKEESFRLQMKKAEILLKAGNYAASRELIEQLPITDDIKPYYKYRLQLLHSSMAEIDNSNAIAKKHLEKSLEYVDRNIDEAVAYNNLARIEEYEGNKINARSYYERAWKALRKSPTPVVYPMILHNLLMLYARTGDKDRALALLESYREIVSDEIPEQYVQFLNDQVHLARELRDRPLLLDAYRRIGETLS